jgi:cobalt-zinc-cadmium resistance protein CzcA
VPLFTLQGIEGRMFAPLAATMLIALLVSLVVALTVIPVAVGGFCCAWRPSASSRFVRRFHQGYLRLLQGALRRRGRTLLAAGAVLAGSLALLPLHGHGVHAAAGRGLASPSTSCACPTPRSRARWSVADFIEKRLLTFPEVDTVVSKTGRAEISEDPMGPEQTDVFVMLKPRGKWGRGPRQGRAGRGHLSATWPAMPGLRYSFSQPIALRVNELISGVKSDLAVKIFGPDLDLLKDSPTAPPPPGRGATAPPTSRSNRSRACRSSTR